MARDPKIDEVIEFVLDHRLMAMCDKPRHAFNIVMRIGDAEITIGEMVRMTDDDPEPDYGEWLLQLCDSKGSDTFQIRTPLDGTPPFLMAHKLIMSLHPTVLAIGYLRLRCPNEETLEKVLEWADQEIKARNREDAVRREQLRNQITGE